MCVITLLTSQMGGGGGGVLNPLNPPLCMHLLAGRLALLIAVICFDYSDCDKIEKVINS